MSRLTARRGLEEQLAGGLPHPDELPNALLLGAIKTSPALFQFRAPLDHQRRSHVADMARAVKDGNPLAALLVWWGGDGWYCLDGHHRLEAYRVGKWALDKPVPVSVYRGSVVQAMLKAAHANSPAKLQMNPREKSQAAWELVTSTTSKEATGSHIAKAATVSRRLVCFMRKVQRGLLARNPDEDLAGSSWWKKREEFARQEGSGEDIDWEARDEEEAKEWAEKIARTFGTRPQTRPETLAKALEIYDSRLVAFFLDYWRDALLPDDPLLTGEETDF